MATTMGIKIDKQTRQRLINAAVSLERTPHWFMKHAIVSWLEKVEAGADEYALTGSIPTGSQFSMGQTNK
jgi:RHH-type proline utilization regulon transcriptional repressor/proline dehydrogenase/delta 1-pyrroline-5-carboxylate dehydrogenase